VGTGAGRSTARYALSVPGTNPTESIGHEFALAATLKSMGPRLNATGGTPVESKLVVYQDRTTEIGIWEVTPGQFPAWKDDVGELMQFIAGRGTITDSTGVTKIEPGVTMYTPDGWKGTWDVEETIRKTYVVHRTKPRVVHGLRVLSRRIKRTSRTRAGQPCRCTFETRVMPGWYLLPLNLFVPSVS
jgi:uncharacterized cupin superfamily protein